MLQINIIQKDNYGDLKAEVNTWVSEQEKSGKITVEDIQIKVVTLSARIYYTAIILFSVETE